METPQTAAQINSPQTGQVDFGKGAAIKPPKLEDLIAAQAAQPIKPAKPPGCWDLSGLSGTREGVMRAVQADAICPQPDKDYICSKIAALPEKFNHVALHGYCHIEKGVWTFDMTLLPSTQLM